MSELVSHVTDASFNADVLEASQPVLVDFWAEWCNPCKMLLPILEEVAAEYSDKVRFVKVNVDENTETPAQFGVRGIPTLILFKDGQSVGTHVGALSASQLKAFIDSHL